MGDILRSVEGKLANGSLFQSVLFLKKDMRAHVSYFVFLFSRTCPLPIQCAEKGETDDSIFSFAIPRR